MDFVCPVCRGTLTSSDNLTKRCPLGHGFDRARAGYYNLLVGRGGKNHGDNREMVDARRAFLSLGYYSPLAERVGELALENSSCGSTVLDVGAGEGYYTRRVADAIINRDGGCNMLAFDISKEAVKQLSRLCPEISTAVASAYSMPIADGTIDLALLLFSPLAREEIHRVLRVGGRLIMVFPGEEHLYGLKAAVYDTPYKNTPEPTELSGFRLLGDESLSYTASLGSREEIKSLFYMTPYAYRTPREARERIEKLTTLKTQIDFRILTYERL